MNKKSNTNNVNDREAREEARIEELHQLDLKRRAQQAHDDAKRQEREESESQSREKESQARIGEIKSSEARRSEEHQATLALVGGLAALMPRLDQLMEVGVTQLSYGSPSAIKASACALRVKAAEKEGTSEALKAASDWLLMVAGGKGGNGAAWEASAVGALKKGKEKQA